ncbi:hypothetical protein [Calidifontibacillus erzurumensis]|uniref:hypothetical protein n=1 Tax=Calidifontibacillus erzurumensis TaxID=2741433 RepID=UPI0035B52EE7
MALGVDIKFYVLVVGIVFYWAVHRMMFQKQRTFASQDFIRSESAEFREREIVAKNFVHNLIFPLYTRLQQINPLSESGYKYLEGLLQKAGQYDTRPEEIQMAQLTNALIYPLFFAVISFLIGGDYKVYIVLFGIFTGFYMYNAPIRSLKQQEKEQNENILQEFTRFVTIYLMLISGNKTVYDALLETVGRTKSKSKALGFYLNNFENDLYTRGPENALRRFSETMNKPYVDRYVNNVLLSLQQAANSTELNLRLRETLVELQNEMVDQKIGRMKVTARIPTYIGVLVMSIYMIVILGASLIMLF